jgi:transposase
MRPHGTPGELEARRLRAAELLAKGMKPADVARAVGSSRSSVTRWKEVIGRDGVKGLKAKPAPGRPPSLSKSQKRKLEKVLLRGPRASGYRTDLWTCPRVADVIERRFGVRYNPNYVWYILRSLGWTCQKPERLARERDEKAIERWRRKDWPRIKKSP